MLHSDRGGEFLGKDFTAFVDGKGIVHDLTCSYTLQQNSMAEREIRTVVDSVRTMLLHMGVQHHWWHLALRHAVWVCNCLERSTLPPRTTPYQLLTGKKPDLSLARVWGYMEQFLVPEKQRGGKLKPKARWGLHLGVSEESGGWELLDLTNNRVVTTSDVVFYETMSLEVWSSEHGPALGRTQVNPPTDTSTATLPLLAEIGELADDDTEDVRPRSPSPAPPAPPLVADLCGLTPVSSAGDEGRSRASPMAPAKSIAGGRRDVQQVGVGVNSTPTGEEQAEEGRHQPTGEQAGVKPIMKQSATRQSATRQSAGEPIAWEKSAGMLTVVQQDAEGSDASDDGGDVEESTDSDVVEVQPGPRRTGRLRGPPDFFVPAAFTTMYDGVDDDLLYDDAEEDEDLPELDPDMHADPKHRWDISTMSVKEALASWKGKAMKAAMEEEICSLIGMGTWELVERPPGVNVMKNRWVLTTKYRINDTVECEEARLVVKGFTQEYGVDYDKMYAPVSSYVTLRIFLSIVAVLDLNLMQLDMKNSFLQSKLNQVLYMNKPDYFNNGTGRGSRRCAAVRLLEEELGQHGALLQGRQGWRDLLDAGLRQRPARRQQQCSDAERPEGAGGGRLRAAAHLAGVETPVLVDAHAELTFDDEEVQERQEEEYRQHVGSLQFVLVGYVDADHAGNKQNRTSTGGYVFVYGGAAISWSSQRIKCATLSSTELEYMAATEAGKEGRRLRFLLTELWQLDAGTPTVLRVDNKSAITVAEGMGLTGNLKDKERRQAWLQHMVKHGKFLLKYILTTEQLADFLTKALHYPAFNRCSVAIGQLRLADVGDGDDDVQQ
ncbi:unnamed protein product [Closterium sp. NIES-53]